MTQRVEDCVEHGGLEQVLRCALHFWSQPSSPQGGERGGVDCEVVSGGGGREGRALMSHNSGGGAGGKGG